MVLLGNCTVCEGYQPMRYWLGGRCAVPGCPGIVVAKPKANRAQSTTDAGSRGGNGGRGGAHENAGASLSSTRAGSKRTHEQASDDTTLVKSEGAGTPEPQSKRKRKGKSRGVSTASATPTTDDSANIDYGEPVDNTVIKKEPTDDKGGLRELTTSSGGPKQVQRTSAWCFDHHVKGHRSDTQRCASMKQHNTVIEPRTTPLAQKIEVDLKAFVENTDAKPVPSTAVEFILHFYRLNQLLVQYLQTMPARDLKMVEILNTLRCNISEELAAEVSNLYEVSNIVADELLYKIKEWMQVQIRDILDNATSNAMANDYEWRRSTGASPNAPLDPTAMLEYLKSPKGDLIQISVLRWQTALRSLHDIISWYHKMVLNLTQASINIIDHWEIVKLSPLLTLICQFSLDLMPRAAGPKVWAKNTIHLVDVVNPEAAINILAVAEASHEKDQEAMVEGQQHVPNDGDEDLIDYSDEEAEERARKQAPAATDGTSEWPPNIHHRSLDQDTNDDSQSEVISILSSESEVEILSPSDFPLPSVE